MIALAGALSTAHNVPLASMWNKDTGRVLSVAHRSNSQNYLVYSFDTEYRAPFSQALLNLFVDTSDRGADNYLAFARKRAILGRTLSATKRTSRRNLQQLGRDNLFQPDAGTWAGQHLQALESLQQLRSAEFVSALERY